ncbi:hypothetical protein BDQ17DRAFT_1322522 [Cyathus striatus]|nr:hypothetical protein BDQ17DRAFT_1322522 [Cyathus striatus]
MSSNVTDPANTKSADTGDAPATNSPGKGKGKAKAPVAVDDSMDQDGEEEEEEEEEEEGDEEDDSEEEEDSLEEIDPSAILPTGRRTRGVKIDYSSEEALQRAGLKREDLEEEEDDVTMKEKPQRILDYYSVKMHRKSGILDWETHQSPFTGNHERLISSSASTWNHYDCAMRNSGQRGVSRRRSRSTSQYPVTDSGALHSRTHLSSAQKVTCRMNIWHKNLMPRFNISHGSTSEDKFRASRSITVNLLLNALVTMHHCLVLHDQMVYLLCESFGGTSGNVGYKPLNLEVIAITNRS